MNPFHNTRTREELRQDALERLEWPRIGQALAACAVLNKTRAELENVSPWIPSEERELIFDLSLEAQEMLALDKAPTIEAFEESLFLDILRRQGVLSPLGLYQVLKVLRSMGAAAQMAKDQRSQKGTSYPLWTQAFTTLSPQPGLVARLSLSVDEDGTILSSASPELKAARTRLEHVRRRIVEHLENHIRRPEVRDALQDAVWALRDGRYVLPVRTDRKNDIPGTVRGVSQSGNTVFVEPQILTHLNVQSEQAEMEVEIEERKVLQSLSESCWALEETLRQGIEVLVRFDDACARAHFSKIINGTRPQFLTPQEGVRFEFRGAKHPLFLVENKKCVPNDLVLAKKSGEKNEGPRVWVLSGPNAGGKTVAMRTVGVLSLMAMAGLMVPALSARLVPFEDVFVEMGDRQDRAEDLSTFSGHLLQVKTIVEKASASTLVLLDEGFVGTDPAVGVALGRATLEFLASKKATVIITTHFSSLKTLADNDFAFANASMEFEPRELRPTYTLLNGFPGQSYALELGARLGLEQKILDTAREYHGEEAQKLEKLLLELQIKKAEINEEWVRQVEARKALEDEIQKLQSEKSTLLHLRDTLVDGMRNRLQKRLNAFENRLETRERQFERHKEQILKQLEWEAQQRHTASEAEPQPIPVPPLPDQPLPPPLRPNPRVQPLHRPPPPPAPPAADKSKPKSLSGFEELARFQFQKSNAQARQEASADVFRKPRQFNSRSLLDEAQESLDLLRGGFDRMEDEFQDQMDSLIALTHASEKVQEARSALKSSPGGSPAAAARTPAVWTPRTKVKCARFKDVGEVLKAADAKGLVECQFGPLKIKIPHGELMTLDEAARSGGGQSGKAQPPPSAKSATPPKGKSGASGRNPLNPDIGPIIQTSTNTVDLRGKQGDEALALASSFIDKSFTKGMDKIVLVHGHGTGRVKQLIRSYLEGAPYDLEFRPGQMGEGGDGVTIVQFH